jgi:hypothetical protein
LDVPATITIPKGKDGFLASASFVTVRSYSLYYSIDRPLPEMPEQIQPYRNLAGACEAWNGMVRVFFFSASLASELCRVKEQLTKVFLGGPRHKFHAGTHSSIINVTKYEMRAKD